MRRLNMAVCLLALMMPVVAQGGGIAVFDNAAVWPYNDTGLTDDLDYLGVSYTKYTPANVADLFVSPNPADPQPIYDYDLVMLASGVWSSTSTPTTPCSPITAPWSRRPYMTTGWGSSRSTRP